MRTNQFKIDDLQLPYDSFSYLSAAYNTTSWLHHIFSADRANVNDVSILYHCALFDEFPIGMRLQVDDNPPIGKYFRSLDILDDLVDWKKFSRCYPALYNECVSSCFKRLQICDNATFTVNHSQLIEQN